MLGAGPRRKPADGIRTVGTGGRATPETGAVLGGGRFRLLSERTQRVEEELRDLDAKNRRPIYCEGGP